MYSKWSEAFKESRVRGLSQESGQSFLTSFTSLDLQETAIELSVAYRDPTQQSETALEQLRLFLVALQLPFLETFQTRQPWLLKQPGYTTVTSYVFEKSPSPPKPILVSTPNSTSLNFSNFESRITPSPATLMP